MQIRPHPQTPASHALRSTPKKREGESDQSPSPALGEGFRVRATKVGAPGLSPLLAGFFEFLKLQLK